MTRKHQFTLFSGIFVLLLLVVFFSGYFRKNVSPENGRFNLELTCDGIPEKSDTVVYDMQNEGHLQNQVRPGRMTLSAGHGSSVLNGSDQPVWLAVKVTGAKDTLKIESMDPIFDNATGRCVKPLTPGEALSLDVSLDMAMEAMDTYLVSGGKIEFLDYKSGNTLGEVPLKVINSKPRSCCCGGVPDK